MPRRALRCVVDLHISAVSAPGVWLPSKEPVYLSISLFNQYRNTACHDSVFPLLINEKFRFEKTYYTAVDPAQVAEILEDELIIFELVQLSEYTDGAVRLASYSTNARDFLYPYPCLAPSYSSHDREILMCRTIAFPGISPKLEFSTKTVIKESASSALDALQDCEELERKSRRSSRTRRSLSRSPSPTVRRKLADISLDDTIDPRPPFVVRKLDDSLIGRIPSSTTEKHAKSRAKRSASPQRPRSSSALDSLNLSTSSKPRYHLTKVIRNPYEEPLPVFKPQYTSTYDNDIDREVEELTSTKPTYVSTRPRSVSPFLYKRSFRDRYGDSLYSLPYSSSYYDSLYERELERARTRRLARLYSSYYNSLDDLELELRLARIRAARY
ncbi:hypothetical protein BsWGS_02999 [Bradybaena similaris]